MTEPRMFHPQPRIEAVSIDNRQACWVIDDTRRNPDAWVAHAVAQRDAFSAQSDACFVTQVHRQLRARRIDRLYSRLARNGVFSSRRSAT